jgi:hypothetical protein
MPEQIKRTPIRQIIADGLLLLGLALGLGALWYWLPGLGALVGGVFLMALIFVLVEMLLKRLMPGFDEWLGERRRWWAECRRIAGRVIQFLIVLAIWGALLWYFAPEQGLTLKPLASLTLNDLGGLAFWFCLLIVGGRMLFAMLERD